MLMMKRYISFDGKRGAVKKGIIISIPPIVKKLKKIIKKN